MHFDWIAVNAAPESVAATKALALVHRVMAAVGELGLIGPYGLSCFSGVVRVIKTAIRATFVVINNLYCIPTYVIWMLALRPLRVLLPAIYWKIEGLLFHWLLAQVAAWSWTAGYEIVETGDEISTCLGKRTLVLANHQSTADVPMLMATWNHRPGILSNLMWIMDNVFKYTNFGVVSLLHQDFFIQSGRTKREKSLELLTKHMQKMYIPLGRQFIVLFPEGGFLHKRKAASHRFAEKNNLPLLEYVSLPRAGALKVIMDNCGPLRHQKPSRYESEDGSIQKTETNHTDEEGLINRKISTTAEEEKSLTKDRMETIDKDSIEWVLDVTIAYENRIPINLKNIVYANRKPCITNLFYRIYRSTEIPTEHEAMTNWLYDRWIEKEKILEEFYNTGKWPERDPSGRCRDTTPRPIRQHTLRFIILHLFFITSTLVHANALWYLYTVGRQIWQINA